MPFDAQPAGRFRVRSIQAGLSVVHAVESGAGLVLIDAGYPGQGRKIARELRKFSSNSLRLIIVTHAHFDHYGSASQLRDLTGAAIAVHEADAADMAAGRTRVDLVRGWGVPGKLVLPVVGTVAKPVPVVADLVLHEGDSLNAYGLAAVVLHTPGHTVGSITVMLGDGTAFVGDLVVAHPWLSAQCYYASDWSAIAASLARVQALRPTRVYSGHSTHPARLEQLLKLVPVKAGE